MNRRIYAIIWGFATYYATDWITGINILAFITSLITMVLVMEEPKEDQNGR